MWRKPNWLVRRRASLSRNEHSNWLPSRKPAAGSEATSQRLASGDRKLRKQVPAQARWDVSQRRWGGGWVRRWRSLALRERPEPIPSFRGPVEPAPSAAEQERIGICCSGGGIRSAAFNLGALQTLQRKEELQRSSYLAAVSGGSYIAAAFAMVATKRAEDTNAKSSDDSDPEVIDREPPFAPGSPEEQYLRNRSSYMAPDGFGKLFILYRVVLGLLFNIAFLATPLFAVMLFAGWWIYRSVYPKLAGPYRQMVKHHATYTSFSYHVPRACWIVPAALAGLSAAFGLLVMLRRLKSDRTRRGLQVLATRLLILAVLVALFSIGLPLLVALAHNVSHDLSSGGKQGAKSTGEAGLAGVLATGGGLAGLIAGILAYVRETLLTPKKALAAIEEGNRAIGSRVRTALAYAGAALAGPLLVIGVMALGVSVSLSYGSSAPKWWVVPVPLAIASAMLLVFAFFYYISDLTSWSLHPFYKRQLCTAFALKRVKAVDAYEIDGELERELLKSPGGKEFLDTPVAMERRFDELVSLSKTALDGKKSAARAGLKPGSPARAWPCLIVCAAANLSDPGATPPGRPVTSFTFSARSVGGPLIGAMDTQQYEEAFDNSQGKPRRRRDLTLPSAVAISGAAVAPSMGKMTRRPLTFLTALANIRLGVWVPNPRRVQGQIQASEGSVVKGKLNPYGRPRPSYLIRELLGRNRVDGKYLFVTDGGHYENLGLVELLRRGCTEIYCFDASNDQDFSVLGDAVALARSELGVQIDIDPSKLAPSKEDSKDAGKNAAKGISEDSVEYGAIRYRDGREGRLIYARCVLTAKAPWDVMAHHNEDPSFPHNSTADQLYTDQKFESYRALGAFVAADAIERMQAQRRAKPLSASAQPPPADAHLAPAT